MNTKLSILEMNRLTVEEFHEAEKMPLVVVLDDVRSLHNVGSVFRTADAFRVESIYLCGITATPEPCEGSTHWSMKGAQEIHKTALGAENSVAWKYFGNAIDAVESLKNDGYTVLAVEQAHGSTMLQDFKTASKDTKYAVVLGNEVKGVHQEVIDICDGCLEIPQYGTKHSLNVSVTGGIIIWHFAQQMVTTA
ncbi:MAG: RNA methyltransferase [Prevotella sp.]|nr:RNA methyltransferase [Candidatus Prevotella equi]